MTKKERRLLVPKELEKQNIVNCFAHNNRAANYAGRLFYAGIDNAGDLNGKTEREVQKIAPTTPKNWTGFKRAMKARGIVLALS